MTAETAHKDCEPWIRQQENQILVVPPATVLTLSDKLQSMIGYRCARCAHR
jgi:hypothetical protein